MKTQRTLVENKKTPLLMLALLALLLTVLLSAYYSSLAFAQSGPKTATGVLSEAAPHGEDPTPVYAITDEATGTSYELVSGFVELQDYVGQKVTIEGVPVPGPGDPSKPPLLNVTQVTPAGGGEDPSPSDKVTLSFELTVEGEPPADAEFLGLTATESLSLTPLTDPDGDGTYTGSTTVAKFAPGGPPEPISISPVQIVQGPPTGTTANGPEYNVIKDFGSVKLDGDKTLSASISFPDDGGGQADSIKGNITSISGSAVLVEETPSAEESGDKGYFTVTDETEITKQEDGESVPATFEDLEVGQQVEATYEGAVAESYPTQGNAESITILERSDNTETSAKLSFELMVEGEPPANAMFSGFIPAEGGISVPLTDPDGDGLYTGSTTVDRFGPGPRPVPPGTEPVSLPVQIVQGTGVIKDFGQVKIDRDKTFSASVSFEGDDGKDGNGGSGNGSSGNSGSGPGGISTLPYTGGTLPMLGIAGAMLIGGGLLMRGILR